MIKIVNLTKVFKSRNKRRCIALNNLSFTLPDSGFVFIIGKSGSGKSTLLNLLGGLDDATKGMIIADGNNITNFSQRKFNMYRSSYAGFIFQDYHLLEELTVEENVSLFLDKNTNETKPMVMEKLRLVGLEEFANSYPSELSGGQQQRVAIARVLAKSPHVILCDEPTGNLDEKTSTSILELLKEISETQLVIIVSHNYQDALNYGDRIIELCEGKIIRDVEKQKKYSNEFRLTEGKVILPYRKALNGKEIRTLMDAIDRGEVKRIVQNGDGYRNTRAIKDDLKPFKLKYRKITKKNLWSLFKAFFKRNKSGSTVTVIVASLIMVFLSIIQSFLAFNGGESIRDNLLAKNEAAFVIQKTKKDAYNTMFSIYDDEYNDLIDDGYQGNAYKLYNYTAKASPSFTSYGAIQQFLSITNNLSSFYIKETYGTLACDGGFLTKKFGVNGEIKLHAGSLENNLTTGGIIITDYFADSIMFYNPGLYSSYEDLLGYHYDASGNATFTNIAAVIDTKYKTKYASLIDVVQDSIKENNGKITLDKVVSQDEYIEFCDDVSQYLGISYSLNNGKDGKKSFHNSIIDLENRDFINLLNFYFTVNNKNIKLSNRYVYGYQNDSFDSTLLNDNEILMHYNIYNSIFGTSYNNDSSSSDYFGNVQPQTVKMKKFNKNDPLNEEVFSKDVVIKIIGTSQVIMSDNTIRELMNYDIIPYALYFDDLNSLDSIVEKVGDDSYLPISLDNSNVRTINRAVQVFEDLFLMFEYILMALALVYIINYGIRSITKHKYQIGIIKSLGGSSLNISTIFSIKTITVGFFICIVSYFGMVYLNGVANQILIDSFESFIGREIYNIDIIKVRYSIIAIDLILVMFITAISSFAPILVLRKIKPAYILKAKE